LRVEIRPQSAITLTEDGREEKGIGHTESFATAPEAWGWQSTMRIGIREQLALLVLLTSMVALAVVSIATVSTSSKGPICKQD